MNERQVKKIQKAAAATAIVAIAGPLGLINPKKFVAHAHDNAKTAVEKRGVLLGALPKLPFIVAEAGISGLTGIIGWSLLGAATVPFAVGFVAMAVAVGTGVYAAAGAVGMLRGTYNSVFNPQRGPGLSMSESEPGVAPPLRSDLPPVMPKSAGPAFKNAASAPAHSVPPPIPKAPAPVPPKLS